MDNSNFSQSSSSHANGPKSSAGTKSHLGEAASHLYEEGKKVATEFYEANAQKVNEAQETIKEYTDELGHQVKSHPISALLIAGGIGFILAKIMSK